MFTCSMSILWYISMLTLAFFLIDKSYKDWAFSKDALYENTEKKYIFFGFQTLYFTYFIHKKLHIRQYVTAY